MKVLGKWPLRLFVSGEVNNFFGKEDKDRLGKRNVKSKDRSFVGDGITCRNGDKG